MAEDAEQAIIRIGKQISASQTWPSQYILLKLLRNDQVDVRIKAINLIKKLLALPGKNVAKDYPRVFAEVLNRCDDISSQVRITALSCAKAFYTPNQSGKESLKVLSAIQDLLLDNVGKVRTEAVNVVCELAKTNLNFAPSDLISLATLRLRDKQVRVRSNALRKLVELYQEYCTGYAAGLTLLNEHVEEIPCKILMLCYEKECREFRPQSMLADLFPTSLSTEERTKHWIFMFSRFKPPHLKALKFILSEKRRLQDWLQDYLDLWNRTEENGSGEAERKMEALVMRMSSSFPDPAKAKDCFQKLYKLKVNGIFRALQQCLDKETAVSYETIKALYLRELGGQNELSAFFDLLFRKCSFNIFSSKHVHYISNCLSGDGAENNHFKDYSVQLLLTIIGAFPSLLRGSETLFQHLILEKVIPFDDKLIEILAREGHHFSIKLSDLYSSLEEMCLEGTRVQAKLAVSVVATLADTNEQTVLAKLCKILVDSLCNGRNASTVLQSLGCLAQHLVSTFEAREPVVTHYIIEEIFQKNNASSSKDLDFFDETSKCCSSCKLKKLKETKVKSSVLLEEHIRILSLSGICKVFGLKALVRSFLPHKQTSIGRPVRFLFDIILQMLQNGGIFRGYIACERDKSCIRLAAAKSVLRLSRKWDLYVSPQIFHLTVLVAKDQFPWIRQSFATKLHKYLKNHLVPSRYACAFSFGSLASLKDLCNDAFDFEEFIPGHGERAKTRKTMAVQGAANHPVNTVVFLIHVLAHDTNFPSPDCQDEKVYAHFLSPLFDTLEALVNGRLGGSYTCNASSYLGSILRAIKRAEDAVDAQMTTKLHFLAEVGISILNSLNPNSAPVMHTPGLVLLPSSLYKSGSAENIETGSTSTNSSKQFDEKSDKLVINKSRDQFNKLHTGQKEQCGISHEEVNTRGRLSQIASSPHRSVGLIYEFFAENELERDAHRKSDAKLSLSLDSVTTVTMSSRVKDTVFRCSSTCAKPSKSSRNSDQENDDSSKVSVGIGDEDASSSSDSSVFDTKLENTPENIELHLREVPQHVNKNKRSNSVIDTSISEVTDVNINSVNLKSTSSFTMIEGADFATESRGQT